MHTIAIDGTVKRVSPEEIVDVKESAELWRSLEREAVGDLLASINANGTVSAPAIVSSPDIPTPDT